MKDNGYLPATIQLIINTHYHSDHVGANAGLQKKYGINIAAHRWEAGLINNNHPEAYCSRWLDRPVEPYIVNCLLSDGDEIETGTEIIRVMHTPCHTLGHICLFLPATQALICGDLLAENDVGWLNIFREGTASIEAAKDSLEKVAKLSLKRIYPGHGPVITNPLETIDHARSRLEKWLKDPEKAAWHACKRIFTCTLMIKDGLPEGEIDDYLMKCPWFNDFSTYIFNLKPIDFIRPLLQEMLRSKAAHWQNNRLMPSTPYNRPFS
nr:MBL fold metallo-hydrolase [Sporotomaculum syntrophicum]